MDSVSWLAELNESCNKAVEANKELQECINNLGIVTELKGMSIERVQESASTALQRVRSSRNGRFF